MKARDYRIKSVTDNRQKQIHSLFSYYLSSPFNLLILLFMQFLYVNEAVTLVVLLKIGLTGVFMAWYVLKKSRGRN